MALKPKQSPAAGEFLFTIDPEPLEEAVTAWGGVPLLVRALRSLDVPGSVARHVHVKQRQRGLDEASYVSSFVALNALGGDCLDDFERLREDEGLPEMLGHPLPSPEAARKFLYQFHDEETLEQAQRELPVGQVSSRRRAPRCAGWRRSTKTPCRRWAGDVEIRRSLPWIWTRP